MSLRLPPILCISYRNSISGCSKALRGLSVQSRVMGIFTHTSISPGPLLRQLTSRYTIRAGRNLPDKEFRYLRTVIVTAALAFADTCVFAKQSLVTILCGLLSQAPLIPKLRGHFAEFLNKGSPVRLRILSSPTCVGFRYGYLWMY